MRAGLFTNTSTTMIASVVLGIVVDGTRLGTAAPPEELPAPAEVDGPPA